MTGIVRQSDQYAAFDNTPAPERTARQDPPESVIREFTRGRSVGVGQLNPAGIRRQHFADAGDVGNFLGDVANNAVNAVTAIPQIGMDFALGSGDPSASFDQLMHPSTGPANQSTTGIGTPVTPTASRRRAVNTHGMDPDSHAYAEESYGGPYDPGGEWVGDETGGRRPLRDWDPNTGYQPDEHDERASELVHQDDESGYNWGPEPHEFGSGSYSPGGGYDDYDHGPGYQG